MTIERAHLLPGNASDLEKAISLATDRSPELVPGVEELAGFKFNPIDAIVPHLVDEYGLTEIEDFFTDLRQTLADGIVWQRERGTPAALHLALSWIGCDGTLEEFPYTRRKWWWFQVHLPDERRSSAFAEPMTAIAKASKPLRSEFARVTAGYDKRAFALNASRLNGGGLLNSWSGVRKNEGGPVLSLRYHHGISADASPGVSVVETMSVRHQSSVAAAAPGSQQASETIIYAAESVDSTADIQFQNAVFVNEPFGSPSPRVQAGFA